MSKNNLVYLYYRHPGSTVKNQIYKIAESIDGSNFEFYKVYKSAVIKPPSLPRWLKNLISPRPGLFDSGPRVVENIFELSSKYFVYYHSTISPGIYYVGLAIFDSQKSLIERSETPAMFISLIRHLENFIAYWDLGQHQIFSVVYPSFKIRRSIFAAISPKLNRIENNPIISPNSQNNWESGQTFNPAVVLVDDRFHFLYRAIGDDGVSRLGYAISETGLAINHRHPNPVFVHQINPPSGPTFDYPNSSGGGIGGAEDPRLVRVGNEDTIYMTYTAFDDRPRVGLSSISVKDFINGDWNWQPPIYISPPGQIHKNWLIFPEKIHGQYAILHAITPNICIDYFDDLNFTGDKKITHSFDPQQVSAHGSSWDKRLRGAGSPPLKTDYGWLMFYHSMNYKIGVMLLDLDDPTKIIYRAKAPILESLASYETTGFNPGIIYVSGAVIKDGTLYVYYGGADSYVCVATANLDQFLSELKQQPPVSLESVIINQVI